MSIAPSEIEHPARPARRPEQNQGVSENPRPQPFDDRDPKLFINRELSWLEFDSRVLEEAEDRTAPIFERLKFYGIVSSNLDEFFMVRVAGLKQQLASGVADTRADGLLPHEQLSAIGQRTHRMMAAHDKVWAEIATELRGQRTQILSPLEFTAEQLAAGKAHFETQVFPALTPLAVDPGHPFPHLRNKSLNIAVMLEQQNGRKRKEPRSRPSLAVVQVPSVLRRLVRLPSSSEQHAFVLLEALIEAHVGALFPGYQVKHTAAFRVTRNWDLAVDEEDSEDLLSTIQDELRKRDRGAAVRLEIAADAPPAVERELTQALHLEEPDVYRLSGPLQPSDLMALTEADQRAELRREAFVPAMPRQLQDASVFAAVEREDLLLSHPFESFDPVVRFIDEAADDPNVLAIKQTLYRTSGDSPFVRALSRAAENGKQVTAIVEIKARFDEANNIAWARRLEENGVHVVYGLIGLKTHCKVALVVRRVGGEIRRYVHLGTGNYNPQTARQYTDMSLFTVRTEFADDVSALFNMLTGYSEAPKWAKLAAAPIDLHERILELIHRETDRARRGEPARISAKLNALVDDEVIRALYAANAAGVPIDLMVRGICCLRPGVPGVSDKIRVTSVVDRFLEHSRVLAFGVGERADIFLSSADWMPRNFQRRVEVMFPIESPAIKARLMTEVFGTAFRDNVKARELQTDGTYRRVVGTEPLIHSQVMLLEAAKHASELGKTPVIRHGSAPT
jgi:polyphosphate kinase